MAQLTVQRLNIEHMEHIKFWLEFEVSGKHCEEVWVARYIARLFEEPHSFYDMSNVLQIRAEIQEIINQLRNEIGIDGVLNMPKCTLNSTIRERFQTSGNTPGYWYERIVILFDFAQDHPLYTPPH